MIRKIFNSREYAVYEILEDEEDVHQYKILIKECCRPTNPSAQIDRDCYSPIEQGLDYAHEMARDMIEKYFSDHPSYRYRRIKKTA